MAKKVAKKAAKKSPVKSQRAKNKPDVSKPSESSTDSAAGDTAAEPEESAIDKKGRGGRKGMHKGHKYKEDCQCGACKKKTAKLKNQLSYEDQLIQDSSKALPDGVGLVKIEDSTYEVMREKVAQLQEKHGAATEQEFINSLVNTAIVFYVKTL